MATTSFNDYLRNFALNLSREFAKSIRKGERRTGDYNNKSSKLCDISYLMTSHTQPKRLTRTI